MSHDQTANEARTEPPTNVDQHPRAVGTGPRLFLEDFDLPVMFLHDAAVRANVEVMARYCEMNDVRLAPHAKTSMTAYAVGLQEAAGSWGMTVATIRQARELYGLGCRRILLANVLVDDRAIAWVARHFLTESSDGVEFLAYVDSVAGVEILERVLRSLPPVNKLGVLVEVGFEGGRTGVRSLDAAVALARRVSRSDQLTLRGIAGYEGLMPRGADAVPAALGPFLTSIHDTVTECHSHGLFETAPIVTAGGSSYFDRVVEVLAPRHFGFPVETILRSGCYVTHDHGMYRDTSPFDGRAAPDSPRFIPALELIATVLSRPEEGLAIVGFGRRDAPTDDRMPVVLGRLDARREVVREPEAIVTGVNDQHAYVRIDPRSTLMPGDQMAFGISHPCGAFDRWRTIPVVDAAGHVVATADPRL